MARSGTSCSSSMSPIRSISSLVWATGLVIFSDAPTSRDPYDIFVYRHTTSEYCVVTSCSGPTGVAIGSVTISRGMIGFSMLCTHTLLAYLASLEGPCTRGHMIFDIVLNGTNGLSASSATALLFAP